MATKVGYRLRPVPIERVDARGWAATLPSETVLEYSDDCGMRSVEDSPQHRGIGRLDIVHIHDVDHVTHGSREADVDTFMLAGGYSLLVQEALDTLFPLRAQRGVALTLGAVFHSGIVAAAAQPGASFDDRLAAPEMLERVAPNGSVCRRYGVPLAAAAIQFSLAHPVVASVVLGMTSSDEREANLVHAICPVPVELWTALRSDGVLRADAPVPVPG